MAALIKAVAFHLQWAQLAGDLAFMGWPVYRTGLKAGRGN